MVEPAVVKGHDIISRLQVSFRGHDVRHLLEQGLAGQEINNYMYRIIKKINNYKYNYIIKNNNEKMKCRFLLTKTRWTININVQIITFINNFNLLRMKRSSFYMQIWELSTIHKILKILEIWNKPDTVVGIPRTVSVAPEPLPGQPSHGRGEGQPVVQGTAWRGQ